VAVNCESQRASKLWQPISRLTLLPFRVSPQGPTIAANAQNSMWSPACGFKQQPASLHLIIGHGPQPLEMAFCLHCSSTFGVITMGHAHLAFGNLRSATSSASCLESATVTGVRLTPEEDSMRRNDSLMLVADRERCAATDSPKRYHPLIQLLTLSSRRKCSLQKEPPLLLVRRPILRVYRTGMDPSSVFRRQARHLHIISAVHLHRPFCLEKVWLSRRSLCAHWNLWV